MRIRTFEACWEAGGSPTSTSIVLSYLAPGGLEFLYTNVLTKDYVANTQMKELLEIAPGYLHDLVAMVSRPKRFLGEVADKKSYNRTRAIYFIVVSSIIVAIIKPRLFFEEVGFPRLLVEEVVFGIFATLTSGMMIYVAWRIVKIRLDLERTLVSFCYIKGVMQIGANLLVAMSVGWLLIDNKTAAEQVYSNFENLPKRFIDPSHLEMALWGEFSRLGYLGHALFSVLASVFSFVWIIVTWGRFRVMAGASKSSSACALVIWLILDSIIFIVLLPVFIQRVLAGG